MIALHGPTLKWTADIGMMERGKLVLGTRQDKQNDDAGERIYTCSEGMASEVGTSSSAYLLQLKAVNAGAVLLDSWSQSSDGEAGRRT